MTDIETLLLTRMTEIRDMQLTLTTALITHTAEDARQFKEILIAMALSKGQIKGFLTAVGLVSGVAGATLALVIKYFMGL